MSKKTLDKGYERRNYNFEVRSEQKSDNVVTLRGLAVVFDSVTNIGPFDEVISKSALDNTNLKDVRFLVNHDVNKIPLARSRNNNENSTLRLNVTDKGLEFEADVDTRNTEASNLVNAVQRGDITGMSFMMLIRDGGYKWDDLKKEHPKRTITDISDIFEISAVTFPAYEDTDLSLRDKELLESDKRSLDNDRLALDNALELEKLKIKILKG